MAELYTAAGAGERPPAHRPVALHGADRGPLRGRRFPLGARVRRRPAAHRLALLYQLGGAPVHSGRAAQGGRVREIPGPVRAVWSRRFDPPAVTAALFPSRRGMSPVTERITRREFLELGAGAGLACMAGAACRTAGPVGPARGLAGPAIPPFALQEATLADLARGIESGKYTAHSLCEYYLARIDDLDRRGPTLRSVIETNPDALRIARELDAERKTKGPRGPLHGIPILVKDNIATADRMATTAGSLALVGARPRADAAIAARLRAAGAVMLGKANLSEWANFRSNSSSSGWSARGGQCKNPYVLDRSPCGSSSGTAAALAANLAAVGVGTETDGSIVCPAAACSLVGIKPTLGLVSRTGIVPIAHSQDTAGPMARTVADAAVLLGVLAGADPRDAATRRAPAPADYTKALDAGALRGARIGVVRKKFLGYNDATDRLTEQAI